MCGICAIVTGASAGPGATGGFLLMHELLAHRGPDGEGALLVDRNGHEHPRARPPGDGDLDALRPVVAVGFRRLSIQDTRPRANQPLGHSSARQWIVLNGELYNFRELRGELEAEGHVFRTRGDSEVALAAYERWGTECFRRFRGMWAILILDLERGRLVGSRDRLGIKPLFWARDGQRLLFASEPRAIAAVQRGGPRVKAARLQEFLAGAPSLVAAATLFDGVEMVPAATVFEIDLRADHPADPVFRTYWDLAEHRCEPPVMPYEEALEQFADLLRASVAEHLVADVPVGSLLSGGLDSSVLARLMAGAWTGAAEGPPTFSVVFDDPAMDESAYVDAVLAQGGLRGYRTHLGASEAWALTDEVTMAYGEPLLGHYLLAYYHLLRSVRAHGVTVVLDGQGSDELLGGYNPMEAMALRERLIRGQWATFGRELRLLAGRSGRSSWAVLRSHVLGPWRGALRERVAAVPGRSRYPWLVPVDGRHTVRGSTADTGRDRSAFNRMAYRLVRHTNLPYLLLFLDRLSMAHGVELRVPYLDHRLVEFCFRLPAAYKVALGERKRLLRHMARAHLPPLVTERGYKMGITSNLRWLPDRTVHGPAVRAAVASTTIRTLPCLRSQALTGFVEDFLAGRHDDALAVWRVYATWRWLEVLRPSIVP